MLHFVYTCLCLWIASETVPTIAICGRGLRAVVWVPSFCWWLFPLSKLHQEVHGKSLCSSRSLLWMCKYILSFINSYYFQHLLTTCTVNLSKKSHVSFSPSWTCFIHSIWIPWFILWKIEFINLQFFLAFNWFSIAGNQVWIFAIFLWRYFSLKHH